MLKIAKSQYVMAVVMKIRLLVKISAIHYVHTSYHCTLSIQICSESAKLTHYHVSGVNGALLQAMAVKLAMQTNSVVDPLSFVDSLLGKISPFEDQYLIGSQSSQQGESCDSQM